MLEIKDKESLLSCQVLQHYTAIMVHNIYPLDQSFAYLLNASKIVYSHEVTDEDLTQSFFEYITQNPQIEIQFDNLVCSVKSKNLLSISILPNIKNITLRTNLNNALNELTTLELCNQLAQLIYVNQLTLELTNCNILGKQGFQKICLIISNLTQLTHFGMRIVSHNIGIDGMAKLSEALSQLQNLTSLDLFIGQGNYIQSEGAICLSNHLPKLKNLTKLSLLIGHHNTIEDSGILAITHSLQLLPKLTELHLLLWCHDNMGLGGGVGSMRNLAQLSKLEFYEAFLKYNINTHKIFQDLLQNYDLPRMRNYKVTFWPGTKEGPLGAIAFGNSLYCMRNITEFYLAMQSVKIGSEGAKGIGQGLKHLQQLKKLTLIMRPNEMKSEGLEAIRQGIESLTSLEQITIEIGENQIEQQDIIKFCETIGEKTNITKYSIVMNDAILIDPIQVVKQMRELYLKCQQNINKQMDAKTSFFQQNMNFGLAATIAIPNFEQI